MRARSFLSGAGRVVLLPPAAFAVHQLRYELAYGSQAGVVLHDTGHSYLHSIVPWLVALIGLATGVFLTRIGRALRTRTSIPQFSLSFGALWALCALSLVAIFACQETLEGIFAVGHPHGVNAVFGDGGLWAIPVSLCIGLVLAALFHGARWAIAQASCWRHRPSRPRRAAPALTWPAAIAVPPRCPLLAGPSSRGPPLLRSI